MIRIRPLLLQPLSRLCQSQRSILRQKRPQRIVLPEDHHHMMRTLRQRPRLTLPRKRCIQRIRLRISAETNHRLLQLLIRNRTICPALRPLMRDIRPIQRLSIIQYRLIQDHIPRASRTLPRHPVIRVKRPAEATKDCKNRKTDHRSEYPKSNVPLWTPQTFVL